MIVRILTSWLLQALNELISCEVVGTEEGLSAENVNKGQEHFEGS